MEGEDHNDGTLLRSLTVKFRGERSKDRDIIVGWFGILMHLPRRLDLALPSIGCSRASMSALGSRSFSHL